LLVSFACKADFEILPRPSYENNEENIRTGQAYLVTSHFKWTLTNSDPPSLEGPTLGFVP
jgi:hypothetical protein